MDPLAAKYIGAGLAMLCILGVGIGIGNIFASYITATARNPEAEAKFKPFTLVGMAVIEILGLIAAVIGLMVFAG
jgi:F-type H+-transporting ATPase subunit c